MPRSAHTLATPSLPAALVGRAAPHSRRTLATRAGAWIQRQLHGLETRLGGRSLVIAGARVYGPRRQRPAGAASVRDVIANLAALDATAYRDEGEDARAAHPYDALAAGAWRRRRQRANGR